MSALSSLSFLWGQVFLQGVSARYQGLMTWLFLLGEPNITLNATTWTRALIGGTLTWLKVISLFCLLGWAVSWLVTAIKEKTVGKGNWLDMAALASIVGAIATVVLRVLEENGKVPVTKITGTSIYSVQVLAVTFGAVFLVWAEAALWSAIRKVGTKVDVAVLLGVHLALVLGIGFGFAMRDATNTLTAGTVQTGMTWVQALVLGLRMSGTYMGYVVLLRVAGHVFVEVLSLRWRRLSAIGLLSIRESNRRMWAPYVVVAFFLVILAFTHWFLLPPRPAELGRLYVGTLSLLCSLLLTVMVTLLTPLSLPHDIQHQTIYTVVSKPVRRIELVWGRMLGFMGIVTVLVFAFGGISLIYLWRTVGGAINETEARAVNARKLGKEAEARQLQDQAGQLRTRMAARVPVYGSLTFLDSKGTPHLHGIDVGQEQSMREPRSHIEGATPATAIWQFGIVEDPLAPEGTRPPLLDRRIPIELMLETGTVEGLLDLTYRQKYRIDAARQRQADPNLKASEAGSLTAVITNAKQELERVEQEYRKLKARVDDIETQAAVAEKADRAGEAATLRRQAAPLHSRPIPLEMTFNVYRTTKGKVGEPVYAELEARNPRTGAEYRNIFPIREYYTNRQNLPASLLAGSAGDLRIEVRCVSPTQYLGMAQSDLFLLAQSGGFGANFMKGLFGIWLQALVLTAIGVFAGTFLSWPVALLTTIAFFVAGQVAFTFLLDFTNQSLQGGGPFESLIRLLSHENLMNELTPTLSVVAAKALDALVMPVMSRLVYVVPNFAALDVSNQVADGFAVSWTLLATNFLLAIAYALPFSVAGYFILKNREVAA
jgi:ABC-type transport system involved in multi-copper enzyme maturation permease subunit